MVITEKLILLGLWPNPDFRAWVKGEEGPRWNNYSTDWQALNYRGWVLGFYHHDPGGRLDFTIIKDRSYLPLYHAVRCVEIALRRLHPLILPSYDPAIFLPNELSGYLARLPSELRDRATHNITSWHKEIYYD